MKKSINFKIKPNDLGIIMSQNFDLFYVDLELKETKKIVDNLIR